MFDLPESGVMWVPPAGEHEAWQEYTGNTVTKVEFDDRMAAMTFEVQSQNIVVVKVNWTVSRMADELGCDCAPNKQLSIFNFIPR